MGLSMKVWLRALNDLVHDLAAGVWPGAVFALWMVSNGARTVVSPGEYATLTRSWTWILAVLLVAVVLQIATGAVRLTHWSSALHPEHVSARGRVALAKHAVFITLFVGAAVAAFSILQG